jgi:glucan phosphoethanolaminetransferase (alkaline phosphatase superfamily)
VRTPTKVPSTPHVGTPLSRNVLFVLTESVRADDVCSAPSPACPTTPVVNALLPNRYPLQQMHTGSTFTALAFASLTSGLSSAAPRSEFLTAPQIWEYAAAAGIETAYLSSQHSDFKGFSNWFRGTPITRRLTATDIDRDAPQIPGADDRLLLQRAGREIAALHEPFFVMVHLSSTHYPYVRNPRDAPFQPEASESSPEGAEKLHNRYRNAIHTQDAALGRFLADFRQTEAGKRTVILFTSDHGESFFEHGVGLHGSTLNEEETHVPAFVDAPDPVTSESERAALRSLRTTPLMDIDWVPTILDLLGLWARPELAPELRKLPGASILRGGPSPTRILVTTNCSAVWRCPFPMWAGWSGHRKWTDRNGTGQCVDFVADPHENEPLPPVDCDAIVSDVEFVRRAHPELTH